MKPRIRPWLPPRIGTRTWTGAGAAVLFSVALVALGYQIPATLEIPMGGAVSSALGARGFHDAEGLYRWSRARSSILFRDPGSVRDASLELEMAGFRPPGRTPPLVLVEVNGRRLRATASRRIRTERFTVEPRGLWSSDLRVALRSETFVPGGGDERALGVRVHRARLVMPAGSGPPLRQLLFAGAASLSAFVLLGLGNAPRRRAVLFAIGPGALLGLAYAFGRLYAAHLVPPVALLLGALVLVDRLLPPVGRFARGLAREAVASAATGLGFLATRASFVVGVVAVGGTFAAYAVRPRVEIDLGSPVSSSFLERFEGLDREDDRVFRRMRAGASVDLRDFGAGSPWRLTLELSHGGAETRTLPVTIDDSLLSLTAGPEWRSVGLEAPAPSWSWRSGGVLRFEGRGSDGLRVSRILLDRGRSAPSIRVLVLVLGGIWLFAVSLRAAGMSNRASAAFGIGLAAATAVAFAQTPVVAVGSAVSLVWTTALALPLAASLRGGLEEAARRGWPRLEPAALGVAVVGFAAWSAACLSPLYDGGHFTYHTNIAEEIWDGRFWLYFLPSPENMLSRQPQWGGIVVPHPSLYHTLASPFAALPHPWFHTATKSFLAVLLTVLAVCAGLVASRADSARAGTWAVLTVVAAPTGYQLLGLGHLMTLFGTWAAALAIGFVVVEAERLGTRGPFWVGALLLSLCFLSYTGSLLFGSTALLLAAGLLWRPDGAAARTLVSMLLVAWAAAFAIYYVHWTLPFVRDSLPALVHGTAAEASIDWGGRLLALPRKLAYTYGAVFFAIVGLGGLALTRHPRRLRLLAAWGSVLPLFAVLDLRFNFLLKHHYFAFPALAIGAGVALAHLSRRGRFGRWLVLLFFVSLLTMGLDEAFRVARGGG